MSTEKTIGWLCAYTPEELIIAAGSHALRISGSGGCGAAQSRLLPPNICPYVRSIPETLNSEGVENLEGLTLVASCDAMRRLADVLRLTFPRTPLHVIDVPRKTGGSALAYLVTQFRLFLNWLSERTGQHPGPDQIREASHLVGRKRRLLLDLSQSRMHNPPGVRGSVFFDMLSRSWKLPVTDALAELSSFTPVEADPGSRFVLSGSIIETSRIHRAVEEAGANVVAEDLCTGLRGVEREECESDDPLIAVAGASLRRPPCSRMAGPAQRSDYILRMVRDYRADGVIYHCLTFCDQYRYDYPMVKERLDEAGVPVLKIETDYQDGDRGRLATRIEAFTELVTR